MRFCSCSGWLLSRWREAGSRSGSQGFERPRLQAPRREESPLNTSYIERNSRSSCQTVDHHVDFISMSLSHLQRLEAESIQIMREGIPEAGKPVMLYSIGKDSSVMLHLARKAFFPAVPPFPLMHIDTTWKFRDMYIMRERMAKESGMEPDYARGHRRGREAGDALFHRQRQLRHADGIEH